MSSNLGIRTVHFIINPHSGYGGNQLPLADLHEALAQQGLRLVDFKTRWAGDATDYARQLDDPSSAVVVWGGDGTVNEVVNGIIGRDIPILPCPIGTENLLAKELQIPSDPLKIAEIFETGRTLHCDVGRINSRNFLMIIGIGFDGEVVRRVAAVRTGHISHLSYFWPIWRTFWEHDFPHMRIVADGQEVFNDVGLAFVGNISRYAVGLRICHHAEYDDGKFDLVVFRCREQSHLLLHAAYTLLRMNPLRGDAVYRQFQHLTIETSNPIPSQVDGDVGPNTPLDIRVLPTQVKLLIPHRRQDWSLWPWKGNPTP